MRLFVSINFDDVTLRKIRSICDGIKPHVVRGYFTRAENMHLTLAFLGEVKPPDTRLIIEALKSVSARGFQLTFNSIGHWKRGGTALYWMGFDNSEPLRDLNSKVISALERSAAPVSIDKKAFKAHLTIGREMTLDKEDFDFVPFSCLVTEFSLMQSELVGGKRTYTPLYTGLLD